MWVLYSACIAVVLSIAIRLIAGRNSVVPPWRDGASIATGVLVGAAVYIAATAAAHVETSIALSAALLWLTASISGVHAVRESRRTHG
ncbi:hypothetical protein ACFVYR_12335 [Streptomyces sp. NPDC058284]|uniref:hypothetical protein n=1 Tax=unclassified Streptomyces TaxID=2593676 RepID=UPI003656A186